MKWNHRHSNVHHADAFHTINCMLLPLLNTVLTFCFKTIELLVFVFNKIRRVLRSFGALVFLFSLLILKILKFLDYFLFSIFG